MSARVLVVDDVPTNIRVLAAKLEAACYGVSTATSGAEALEVARRERPDLILLDVMMPEMDGFECCRRLKADPDLAAIPVVMVTALDQPSDRVRGLEAGADDFLTKPPNDLALFARVRSLVRVKMMLDELRMRRVTLAELGDDADPASPAELTPEGRVVVVERRQGRAEAISRTLRETLPVICVTTDSTRSALSAAGRDAPDLFIVSSRLGEEDGLKLCVELRSRPEARDAAVMLVVEDGDFDTVAAGLDLGVDDYLMRPIDANELVARARAQLRRKRYADLLRDRAQAGLRMALTDGLTGLYNRRYADQHVESHVRRADAHGLPLSFLLLDLDHFKSINDRYGHAAGDHVLIEFARRLQSSVRSVDLVARYGGEEFLAVMPEARVDEAVRAAERIRHAVAQSSFLVGDAAIDADGGVDVTVSIGVAERAAGAGERADLAIRRADAALYASKSGGRNRVIAASAPELAPAHDDADEAAPHAAAG